MKKFELWHGDCLELMKDIPDDMAKVIFDTEYAEYERKRLECLPDALRTA